jgi:hypothetical protein
LKIVHSFVRAELGCRESLIITALDTIIQKLGCTLSRINVYDELKDINNKIDFEDKLMDIADRLGNGTFGI